MSWVFQPLAPAGAALLGTVVVNLTSPTDNAPSVSQPITFSWGSVAGATDYNLQVSTSSLFTTTEADVITTNTSYEVSGLTASAEHFWRVRYRYYAL